MTCGKNLYTIVLLIKISSTIYFSKKSDIKIPITRNNFTLIIKIIDMINYVQYISQKHN